MFKKAQVMLLPTNKKATLMLNNGRTLMLFDNKYHNKQEYDYIKPHELYIINDDKIENGDWYYHPVIKGNSIVQYFEEKHFSNDSSISLANLKAKKIIACTNELVYTKQNKHLGQAIIHLPQPSQQFIEAYIKAFNEGKPIVDILVEYENYFPPNERDADGYPIDYWRLKVDKNNNITIRKIQDSFSTQFIFFLHY